MKPEDLVVGNLYIYVEPNEMPYFLKYIESQCEGYYRFKVVESGELMVIHESAFDCLNKEAVIPLRKPEEIRLELTEEEYIKALSSLGYDLANYEFNESYSFPTFVLRLKKEANEKTRTDKD